jgi:hypothetical protein
MIFYARNYAHSYAYVKRKPSGEREEISSESKASRARRRKAAGATV